MIFNIKYMILKFLKLNRKRKRQKRFHFIIDTSLSILILILIVTLFTFNLYQPQTKQPVFVEPVEPDPPVEINDPLDLSFSLHSNINDFNSGIILNLDYFNHGEEIIDEFKVSFESLSSAFNISNIQAEKLDENSQLIARNLLIKDVASLEGGNISLKIHFSKPSDPLIRQAAWRALVKFDYLAEKFEQEHELTNICFLSDTKVIAEAYYNSARGDQLGIGPIPPIVGISSSYWVFFEVNNLGNDLEDFLISARLPDYTRLTGKRTLLAGNYSYNEENRRLIWQVNQINKSGGDYKAGFEIEVLPENHHVGNILNIAENIAYRFTDSLCRQETRANLGNLDTNLKDDFINQGQGTVIE
jgi:hypothetical protein